MKAARLFTLSFAKSEQLPRTGNAQRLPGGKNIPGRKVVITRCINRRLVHLVTIKANAMNSYIISTERLGLRNWVDADVLPCIEMNQDADVMKYFPATLTDTETLEMIERIKLHFHKHKFGLFAVEHTATKQFIGFTGFAIPAFEAFFLPCVEIGWRYKKEMWGQGFATEAANACIQYGFSTLGFGKIVSFTSAINKSSERVMKRAGMRFTAYFEHPKMPIDNALCRHVLYEIDKPE